MEETLSTQAEQSFFSSPAARLLLLHRAFVNNPRQFLKLLNHHGSAGELLAAIPGIIASNKVRGKTAAALANLDWKGVENDIEWLSQSDDRFILTISGGYYPELLRQIADPPVVLFGRGDQEILSSRQVAIVGSRVASEGGMRRAARLAAGLSEQGITVSSGLAVGIDSSAHRAVVARGGKALAVLGSGIDNIYPNSHTRLAESIIQAGGVVLSEFATKIAPLPHNFPQRNRIISGLSMAVVVVEAALNSGSLITARLAAEQGREVLAVPGNPDNPLSRGCHSLLRDGAGLVENSDDILQLLGIERPEAENSHGGSGSGAQPEELPRNWGSFLTW